jgi:hypothetical protein
MKKFLNICFIVASLNAMDDNIDPKVARNLLEFSSFCYQNAQAAPKLQCSAYLQRLAAFKKQYNPYAESQFQPNDKTCSKYYECLDNLIDSNITNSEWRIYYKGLYQRMELGRNDLTPLTPLLEDRKKQLDLKRQGATPASEYPSSNQHQIGTGIRTDLPNPNARIGKHNIPIESDKAKVCHEACRAFYDYWVQTGNKPNDVTKYKDYKVCCKKMTPPWYSKFFRYRQN